VIPLSSRFRDAVTRGLFLHRRQKRKKTKEERARGDTEVPYAAHLFSVAALAMEHGADEDETIAAFLHDAVEDQGGEELLVELEEIYGPRVAMIIRGCSDSLAAPGEERGEWRARKDRFIEFIRNEADSSVLLVVACDKIHNARSVVTDLARFGTQIFTRFSSGQEGTLWYYRATLNALRSREADMRTGLQRLLLDDLERIVDRMERFSAE
jgi:(p)ppGpp synthase/HD superfamily hydrolase